VDVDTVKKAMKHGQQRLKGVVYVANFLGSLHNKRWETILSRNMRLGDDAPVVKPQKRRRSPFHQEPLPDEIPSQRHTTAIRRRPHKRGRGLGSGVDKELDETDDRR
jgi:hypothetical protein